MKGDFVPSEKRYSVQAILYRFVGGGVKDNRLDTILQFGGEA
jgi:hypothetical protein